MNGYGRRANVMRILVLVLVLGGVHRAVADVRVGLLPAVTIYSGAVGFDGTVHGEWAPPAVTEVIPGLGFLAVAGYSFISQSDVTTQGILLGAGVGYRYEFAGDLPLSISGGLLGGVQFTFFDGDDLTTDSEVPILLLPHLEVAYGITDRIEVGVWSGLKILFYDSDADDPMERSFSVGPRVRYRFGS